MSKKEKAFEKTIPLIESKVWFAYKDLPEDDGGYRKHDMLRDLKRKGYVFEDKKDKVKYFRWTGEMFASEIRTGAQAKAKKFLTKPRYCPFSGNSGKGSDPFVIDHRDGRIVKEGNDIALDDITVKTANDHFMFISRSANASKREACRRCTETNIKEPARVCGNIINQGNYEGTCRECFWYNPTEYVSRRLK